MEANAALRTIVRRDSGEGYREMLTRMARESGIETPTAEDLVRLDGNRKLFNADWQSSTDPDARIAKLKDGRTHLAYKPEYAMDLETGAVVTAEVHAADPAVEIAHFRTAPRRVFTCHGDDAARRRATTTERGYSQRWLAKHSSFVPNWWNAASP